jgi:hypothetical protein
MSSNVKNEKIVSLILNHLDSLYELSINRDMEQPILVIVNKEKFYYTDSLRTFYLIENSTFNKLKLENNGNKIWNFSLKFRGRLITGQFKYVHDEGKDLIYIENYKLLIKSSYPLRNVGNVPD